MKSTLPHKATNSQAERKHYRTELPNIIDDLGLDVYEFRLYAHIKRVAGENGYCNQNNETMAKACGFSHPKVIDAKKALSKPRPELSGKSLITRHGKSGKTIRVVDIWSENLKTYKKASIGEAENSKADLVSDNESALLSSKAHLPNSKSGLHKERTYKKEQNKEREENSPSSFQEKDEVLDADVISDEIMNAPSIPLPKSSAKRVSPSTLPDGWKPSKDGLYWAWYLLNKTINVTTATAKFIDHCKAKRKTSYDWDAEWRKWMHNERALTPSEISNHSEEEHTMIIGSSVDAFTYVEEDIIERVLSFEADVVPFEWIQEDLPEYTTEVLRHALRRMTEYGNYLIEPEQDNFQATPDAIDEYGYEEEEESLFAHSEG